MSKGGKNTRYRAGATFEREVLALMKTWLHRQYKVLVEGIRSAGSKGIRDLVLIHRAGAHPPSVLYPRVWYVSCKRDGRIAPQEKLILLRTCEAIQATPAFAYRKQISLMRWQVRLRVWDYDGKVLSDKDLKAELGMSQELHIKKPPLKGKARKKGRVEALRRSVSKRDWTEFKKWRDLMAGPAAVRVAPEDRMRGLVPPPPVGAPEPALVPGEPHPAHPVWIPAPNPLKDTEKV